MFWIGVAVLAVVLNIGALLMICENEKNVSRVLMSLGALFSSCVLEYFSIVAL